MEKVTVSNYFDNIYKSVMEKAKRPTQQVQAKEDLVYAMASTYSGISPSMNDPWVDSSDATKYIKDNFPALVKATLNGYKVMDKNIDKVYSTLVDKAVIEA